MKKAYKVLLLVDLIAFTILLIIGGSWWFWSLLLGLLTALFMVLKSAGVILPMILGLAGSPSLYITSLILILCNIVAHLCIKDRPNYSTT